MRGKVLIGASVETAFIGVQPRLAVDVLFDDALHRGLIGNRNVERANTTAALDKREDRALTGRTNFAALGERTAATLRRDARFFDLAEIGFVGFDNAAVAAHRGK